MRNKLWIAATLACLGDVVTTSYGMLVLGLPEVNPILATAMAAVGIIPALVLSKVMVLAVGVVVAYLMLDHKWLIPALVVVMYAGITMLNTLAILLVV